MFVYYSNLGLKGIKITKRIMQSLNILTSW
jgi:hypothetical protein